MTVHNHGPDYEKNKIEIDKYLIKLRALETSEKARDIITNTIKNYTCNELERFPKIKSFTDQVK